MAITTRWIGMDDLDRVAETRLRCYAPASKQLEKYRESIRQDSRAQPGDFLLAEEWGESVGTTTSMSFRTWVRGAPVATQGVAWVGTIRTRRRGGTASEAGIASQLMHETLRMAREREQVLSFLMPFRASFYEHFGYGLVERRHDWTIPVSILPKGPISGLRFIEPEDRPVVQEAYQQFVQRGQCELERSPATWSEVWRNEATEGFEVIDRPDPNGPVHGYLQYDQIVQQQKDVLRVRLHFTRDLAAFQRQLHFLAGLKDQYFAVQMTFPADLPLNWHLTEHQLPHRLVNHPVAEAKPVTRLQARVLNHRKLIEAMHLPVDAKGEAVVAVHETEKTVSKFRVVIDGGRATAAPTDSSPDVECTDVTWAAIVLGDLPASRAAMNQLLQATEPHRLETLDLFARGPAPFCQEGF